MLRTLGRSLLAASHTDTIFALSSAPGKAGLAVIRVSGPRASEVLTRIAPGIKDRITGSYLPNPRQAVFRRIWHPSSGDFLDRGLVLWFPGPASFTGEDVVELHIHGGTAVIRGVLDALGCVDAGFRMAERGEFSRRAFENNKLDLTSVEGIADLLNAETEAQRKQALRQAEGGLKQLYESWRTQMLKSMAPLEALIDFGEEDGIEEKVIDRVVIIIRSLRASIYKHTDDNRRGEILRDGINVTILGPPNAGKSSFLNRMAQRQAAIVSPIPGTTRDVVEVALNVAGYPVIMSDTAGLRDSQDVIEMEGVKRALRRIDSADIKICLLSLPDLLSERSTPLIHMTRDIIDPDTLLILNKCDTIPGSPAVINNSALIRRIFAMSTPMHIWTLSCETGEGFDKFMNEFVEILSDKFDPAAASVSSGSVITQARHREHLKDCLMALDTFLDDPYSDVVLAAEELRQAAGALGRITGQVDVEEILELVFREFCIGK
ncbi:tRNA modification GTPase GTPBP3, mitochondrial-like protein [Jimgerdemannia flammicorona]|uniref:tRNA modification GTPase GTPBP3, mitochondrial-like protein n=1 Tax=Jimgerdemannia flammicorona TaxID=994334 RepID=A0A433QX67_9FUNG|nr:tRNA modification GTPase GTPBP3, mitochondrial-like protein [Jimgerdemannia flammicorona]